MCWFLIQLELIVYYITEEILTTNSENIDVKPAAAKGKWLLSGMRKNTTTAVAAATEEEVKEEEDEKRNRRRKNS